ncbi:ribonuclease III [Thiohalospira sp.]|uniref:ribonuclease III n=1 Tax=Thiohalospira sp. TaxID=3080549 RepID=UPI00397ECC55
MATDVAALAGRLGHDFADPTLLERALTHRSSGSANNERLEFLGDSVLNFVMSCVLYERFPEATEGELSRLRALLVKGDTLARLAQGLELGAYLRLGSGERKSGGQRRNSILADTVEALIGAIYLDAGLERASDVIHALYDGELEQLPPLSRLKDPKTRLQEYLQARGQERPTYEVVRTNGSHHEQNFEVACRVAPLSEPVRGTGTSRRKAEQAAAEAALEQLER